MEATGISTNHSRRVLTAQQVNLTTKTPKSVSAQQVIPTMMESLVCLVLKEQTSIKIRRNVFLAQQASLTTETPKSVSAQQVIPTMMELLVCRALTLNIGIHSRNLVNLVLMAPTLILRHQFAKLVLFKNLYSEMEYAILALTILNTILKKGYVLKLKPKLSQSQFLLVQMEQHIILKLKNVNALQISLMMMALNV